MKSILITITILFSAFAVSAGEPCDTLTYTYKLHGQTRRFKVTFQPGNDGSIVMKWNIVRNLKLWEGSYTMSSAAVADGDSLSFIMPEDGNHVTLPDDTTFGIISTCALESLHRDGEMRYSGMTYRLTGRESHPMGDTLHVIDHAEGGEMWILDNPRLPIIVRIANNPLEIDWTTSCPTR